MRVGPSPRRARSAAQRDVASTARKSLPSTRSEAMPLPTPRAAKVAASPPAMPWNDEIAHWLLTMLRITGARYTAANVRALWKSASAVDPSPIQAEAMRVSPLIADAIPHPDGLDVLRAEIARNGKEAVPARRIHYRQLPTLDRVVLVRQQLAHHVHEAVAARDQDALLAIGGKAHVVRFERQRLADADRLLAQALHVERQFLLPLGDLHAGVEDAGPQHCAQAGAQQFGVRPRIPGTHGASLRRRGPGPTHRRRRRSPTAGCRRPAGAPRRRATAAGMRNRFRARGVRSVRARAGGVGDTGSSVVFRGVVFRLLFRPAPGRSVRRGWLAPAGPRPVPGSAPRGA